MFYLVKNNDAINTPYMVYYRDTPKGVKRRKRYFNSFMAALRVLKIMEDRHNET